MEEQKVYYFSYGYNMSQDDMDFWCVKMGLPQIRIRDKNPKVAILKGYRMDFNFMSGRRRGGSVNLIPSPNDFVEGLVMELTTDEMKNLDIKEGTPFVYRRMEVDVELRDGRKLEKVNVYKVNPERECNEYVLPTQKLMKTILKSATDWGLSDEWLEKLKKFATR